MTPENTLTLKTYQEKIEEKLLELTAEKLPLREIITEAVQYSLMAGGKRLRPVLMMEFCRMCGGNVAEILDIACTIEMIHTFSLIHDDLPCMDDDDYRRGMPSCHKAFPECIALLAGDALNTLPFEVISSAAMEGRIDAQTAVMLISVLSRAVGIGGMIGGQVIDLQSEGREVDINTLETLQQNKTGALIEAACVMGVILSGKMEKISAAARYASALGRAFQIVDDILDVTGTFEELGKPIGSDEKQKKSTFVSAMGIEGAYEEAERLTNAALECLNEFEDNGFMRELTISLLDRKR